MKQIKELQRLLGKKIMENELLKEAVEYAAKKSEYSGEHTDQTGDFCVCCLGMAKESMARTITQFSGGRINTLTTSPTKENEISFYDSRVIEGAEFLCAPFFKFVRRKI